MSFQYVIDNCTTLSINRTDTVSQTQSRNGTVKTVVRGTPKKTFTIKLPDGPKWADERASIEALETLDKHTSGTITITYAKHPWYYSNSTPGSEESYSVICVDFPSWEVFSNNQIRWSGPFVFVEV
tara:strand:- start:4306 stop:4683 length:378 start_codon:yes stop_codon:yes gene_type:complete